MRLNRLSALAALTFLFGCATEVAPSDATGTAGAASSTDATPTGKGGGIRPQSFDDVARELASPDARTAAIRYHGGAVINGTPDIYYIWYGNWAGNTATTILTDFVSSLGGSPYENILTSYVANGTALTGKLAYKGSYSTSAYLGTNLSDGNILTIVGDAVKGGHLPYDANAIYFVLTSAEVKESSGFCSQYCGWHQNGTIAAGKVRYSFVGNPDQCPSACEDQTTSPNGNAGADGMASIIAHESEEAISDPDGTGWYFNTGAENGDKCAWKFGTESTAANGSKYNVTLGSRQYLIQQNWVAGTNGHCAMSYP